MLRMLHCFMSGLQGAFFSLLHYELKIHYDLKTLSSLSHPQPFLSTWLQVHPVSIFFSGHFNISYGSAYIRKLPHMKNKNIYKR